MPTGKIRTPGAPQIRRSACRRRWRSCRARSPRRSRRRPRPRSGATTSTNGSRISRAGSRCANGMPPRRIARPGAGSATSSRAANASSVSTRRKVSTWRRCACGFRRSRPASAPNSSGNSGCRAKRSSSAPRPSARRLIDGREGGALVSIPGGVFELDYAVKAALRPAPTIASPRSAGTPGTRWNFTTAWSPAGQPEDLFVEMRFGTKSLGQGTREFERKVFGGEMDHGGNPVARWMIGHCNVRFDENMNYVPAKKRIRGLDRRRRRGRDGRGDGDGAGSAATWIDPAMSIIDHPGRSSRAGARPSRGSFAGREFGGPDHGVHAGRRPGTICSVRTRGPAGADRATRRRRRRRSMPASI
jgi:hypothetical protein